MVQTSTVHPRADTCHVAQVGRHLGMTGEYSLFGDQELQSSRQANGLTGVIAIVDVNFLTVEGGSVNIDRVLIEHPSNRMNGASLWFALDWRLTRLRVDARSTWRLNALSRNENPRCESAPLSPMVCDPVGFFKSCKFPGSNCALTRFRVTFPGSGCSASSGIRPSSRRRVDYIDKRRCWAIV